MLLFFSNLMSIKKVILIKDYQQLLNNFKYMQTVFQGLADAFVMMRYAYESEEATQLNKQIFETMYYAALEASCELAEKNGTYETYEGSPVSQGILQYEMWGVTPTDLWDWNALKEKIAKYVVYVPLT